MTKLTLVRPWRLVKSVLSDYRKNWWSYARIVLVVQVPIGLLSLWLSTDPTLKAYASFATIVMNMALIYTIAQMTKGATRPSFKEAFYTGTKRLVPFLLASLMLVLALMPGLLGLALYSNATISLDGSMVPAGQQLIGGLLALILALPSFWLGTRWIFAPYAAMLDGLDPIQAVKTSRTYTLGYYWRILGRIVLLLVVIVLIATVIAIPSFLIGQATGFIVVILALFQIISTCVVLPLAHIYLLQLYRSLKPESE
jgi:hypothetical protein